MLKGAYQLASKALSVGLQTIRVTRPIGSRLCWCRRLIYLYAMRRLVSWLEHRTSPTMAAVIVGVCLALVGIPLVAGCFFLLYQVLAWGGFGFMLIVVGLSVPLGIAIGISLLTGVVIVAVRHRRNKK